VTRLLASATLPSPVTAILRTISGLRIEAAEDVGQLSGVPDRGRESGMGTGYSLMLISVGPGSPRPRVLMAPGTHCSNNW
jgi:hypothetical protein